MNVLEVSEMQTHLWNIVAPSWIPRLPKEFGESGCGKLKADQWRYAGLVYLPLIMLAVWGERNDRKPHIKNLLYLATALKTAIPRVVTTYSVALYQKAIRLYLQSLGTITPAYNFTISHHLALHYHLFMQSHGPAPTQWQFPTERIIGRLQKIRHNFKIGLYS
jgi:hypothetical protein